MTVCTVCSRTFGLRVFTNVPVLQGDNLVCDNGICTEAPAAVSPSPTPVSPAPASPAPTPGAACGDLDWPCCAHDGPEGGECPKGDNLKCMDGVCRVAACGDPGWPCCAPDGPEGGECPKVRTRSIHLAYLYAVVRLATVSCARRVPGHSTDIAQCRLSSSSIA